MPGRFQFWMVWCVLEIIKFITMQAIRIHGWAVLDERGWVGIVWAG